MLACLSFWRTSSSSSGPLSSSPGGPGGLTSVGGFGSVLWGLGSGRTALLEPLPSPLGGSFVPLPAVSAVGCGALSATATAAAGAAAAAGGAAAAAAAVVSVC